MRVIDIHAHILPGLDDGSKSMEETLCMLQIAEEEGVTDIIATPHYQAGRYFTPAERIQEMVSRVQEQAAEQGMSIRLYPGMEIYYRNGLEERLDGGGLSALNGSDRILMEFAPMEGYGYVRNAMCELRGIGYVPVLAHVERFRCMLESVEHVRDLRRLGCEIQASADGICGKYGFRIKRYLHGLLQEELVDYVGTDAHNTAERAPRMKRCTEILYRKYDADYVGSILHGNAEERLLIS